VDLSKDEEIARLLDHGADINGVDKHGKTPLIHASRYGNLPTMKLLLARGALVNLADAHGWTPLHFAANNGCKESITTLIDAGAELNHKTIVVSPFSCIL
jgi:ankyrin repeat protein